MARTPRTKKTAQIRDIACVRALLKTALDTPPSPPQPLGLPKMPLSSAPQAALPTAPGLNAPPPANKLTPALSVPPAPTPPKPALPAPQPGLPVMPVANGAPSASAPAPEPSPPLELPATQEPAQKAPLVFPAPQPQPMARPAQAPASAISPSGGPSMPDESDAALPPPAVTPDVPSTVAREPVAPPAPQTAAAPLQRATAAAPETPDGRLLNQQLETTAKEKWGPKLKNAKTQDEINAVVREAAPEIEKLIAPETLKTHSAALQDLKAGRSDTDAVKRLMTEQVGPAGDKFIADATAQANALDPYGFGKARATATNMWNSLGDFGQIAFAMGVPLTLVGMFGNSGMASMLGLLGLGAAGGFAALNGAFGEEPAKLVSGLVGGAAKNMGINVPSREQYEKRIRDASMVSQEAGEAELKKVQDEVRAYEGISHDARSFNSASSANPRKYLYDKAAPVAAEQVRGVHNRVVPTAAKSLPGLARYGLSKVPEAYKQYIPSQVGGAIDSADAVLNPTDEQLGGLGLWLRGWKKASAIDIALGRAKSARCWSGYEPVPGAKAYSEGSCRPKGSKKTKKEVIQGKKHTEKKAGGPGTGAAIIGQRQLPPRSVDYRDKPITAAEAANIKKHFAQSGSTSAYAQSMAKANDPEVVRKILEGYGRANYGNDNKFTQGIAEILGGVNVPQAAGAPRAPARPVRQPVPPRPVGPCGPNGCRPRPAPKPPARPVATMMPPKTAKVDFLDAAKQRLRVSAKASRPKENYVPPKPEPLPRVSPVTPPADGKVSPLK